MNKLFIGATKSVIDEQNKLIVGAVGSNGIIDRHGESLNPMGWILDNYLKNPVILFAHDYSSLPIGKAVKVWIENKQLMFTIQFADTPMANQVFDLFKGGFLNAFSVGFIPTKFGVSGNDEYTYMEQELLELSAVPVPANPEALANAEVMARIKALDDMAKKEVEEQKKDEPTAEEPKIEEPKADEPKEPVVEEPVVPTEPTVDVQEGGNSDNDVQDNGETTDDTVLAEDKDKIVKENFDAEDFLRKLKGERGKVQDAERLAVLKGIQGAFREQDKKIGLILLELKNLLLKGGE